MFMKENELLQNIYRIREYVALSELGKSSGHHNPGLRRKTGLPWAGIGRSFRAQEIGCITMAHTLRKSNYCIKDYNNPMDKHLMALKGPSLYSPAFQCRVNEKKPDVYEKNRVYINPGLAFQPLVPKQRFMNKKENPI